MCPEDEPTSDSPCHGSPKRQRLHNSEDIQSSPQFANKLTLNAGNTFGPLSESSGFSSDPQRSPSPTRISRQDLEKARPPIIFHSISGLDEAPPQLVQELGDRLANGVNSGFIPHGLSHTIKNDREVGYQLIQPTDFDYGDERSAAELLTLWEAAKNIFINAQECSKRSRDKNAWCDDVVRPLIRLAIKVYGKGKWWMQSVQSQSIDPRYLSTIETPLLGKTNRRKTIDRKTDYILSFSHRDPAIAALYKRIYDANIGDIGYTTDLFTSRTAAFSNFEVKLSNGNIEEAELQMSVGISASLRHKQELACFTQVPFKPAAMVEPTVTIVGHYHRVYYAYPLDTLGAVQVLGPEDSRFPHLSTGSIRGVFQLLRLYGNILEYGMDEGASGYWGRFLGPLLESLAMPKGGDVRDEIFQN